MAEPFSILAGAAGVSDVALKTSSKLRSLASDFRHAPDLILALSNEATDVSVVLSRVEDTRGAVDSLNEPQHDATFLAELDDQLGKARSALADLEALTTYLRAGNPSKEGFRWLKRKKQAERLKNKLQDARLKINELLVAHNPSLGSRIKLELHDVRAAQASTTVAMQAMTSNIQATTSELVNLRSTIDKYQAVLSLDSQVGQRSLDRLEKAQIRQSDAIQANFKTTSAELGSIRTSMDQHQAMVGSELVGRTQAIDQLREEQTKQFESTQIIQAAILRELGGMSAGALRGRSHGLPSVPPNASHASVQTDWAIFFTLRLRRSPCANDCRCRCHLYGPADLPSFRMPYLLRAAIGTLFVRYTGLPGSSSVSCNTKLCTRRKQVRLQITYGFPLWFLGYVVQVLMEASTAGTLTFALAARRRAGYRDPGLFHHVYYGNLEALERLLEREPASLQDVYHLDNRSVLTWALTECTSNQIATIKLLLRYGADPDMPDDFGVSARQEGAKRMLDGYFADSDRQELQTLLLLGQACEDALDLGYIHKVVLGILPLSLETVLAHPIPKLQLDAQDGIGRTPLNWAVARGNALQVAALIGARADLNTADNFGNSPLHRAAISQTPGMPDCVDALLRAEVNLEVINNDGHIPLAGAAEWGNIAVLQRLIKAGTPVDTPSRNTGDTALFRAALYNETGAIRCLLDADAQLEYTNFDGETAIFEACREGNAHEAFELLVSLGANTARVTSQEQTLLHQMAKWASLERLRAFAKVRVRGQHPLAKDRNGMTARQLLDKHDPDNDLLAAFLELEQEWSKPEETSTMDDNASDSEDVFHDALEELP